MLSAELMGNVYWHLLQRLERSRFQVLADTPIRLSKPRKLSLILSAALRARLGFSFSDYGY